VRNDESPVKHVHGPVPSGLATAAPHALWDPSTRPATGSEHP